MSTTAGSPADLVFDNPIIVKHRRSRLRTSQIVPGLVAVLCICGVSTFIGQAAGGLASGGIFVALAVIAGLVLVVGGSNQVAMAVGTAKESGILDFHRVSPLPASTVALGFFLGAPIREYLLFGVMMPFVILAAMLGGIPFRIFFDVIAAIVMTAWMIHAIALLAALVARRPRMASIGVVVMTFMGLYFGTGGVVAILAAQRQNGQPIDVGTIHFFAIPLPRLAFLALYELSATTFFLIAGARKMRADRALPYAKWEALVFMATIVALALGPFWMAKGMPFLVVGMLYVLTLAGIVLASTITPDLNDYMKGVRRARRQGHRRAPVLADSAANTWAVSGLAAWVAVGATIAWEAIESQLPVGGPGPMAGPAPNGRLAYSQTIAVAAFTVAYYGFGKQFFLLKFGRKGTGYFRLFIFLVWLMPLMLGAALGVANAGPQAIQMAMGVSPWAGLILSVNGGPAVNAGAAEAVRFMALVPSLALAFGFHFLLLNEQRKLDRGLESMPNRKPEGEPAFV